MKGICAGCRRLVRLKRDGTVGSHDPWSQVCDVDGEHDHRRCIRSVAGQRSGKPLLGWGGRLWVNLCEGPTKMLPRRGQPCTGVGLPPFDLAEYAHDIALNVWWLSSEVAGLQRDIRRLFEVWHSHEWIDPAAIARANEGLD